jgi:hypothetical protein
MLAKGFALKKHTHWAEIAPCRFPLLRDGYFILQPVHKAIAKHIPVELRSVMPMNPGSQKKPLANSNRWFWMPASAAMTSYILA